MLLFNLTILLILLILSFASNSLDFRYLCWPSYFTIGNLIKDLEITGKAQYHIDSIRNNCAIKYHYVDSNMPNEVKLFKKNSKWIASFTFLNFSLPLKKLENSAQNSFETLWILYLIIPEAFSCYKCRISMSLDFGHFNFSTMLQVKYGFIRANFPIFIDYTSKETIKREDKSKFRKFNFSLLSKKDSMNVFFIDDNFFGDFNQHLLLGISELNSNNQSSYFLNNFSSPSVIYHICYTYKRNNYVPDTTCYPYIYNQSIAKCICWETYNLKQYFMFSVVTLFFTTSLLILWCRHKKPQDVNEVNVSTVDNVSDDFQSSKTPSNSLIYFVKVLIRLGSIENHKLPGKLEINFKGISGAPLMDIVINCGQKFSNNHLATHDVNELVVKVELDHLFENPTLAEVTYFKELNNEKAESIYLYGFQFETHIFRTTFPYSHYLKSHRQVVVSNEQAWNQAISRDYSLSRFPITNPIVQSLTSFERNLMLIFSFVTVCSNIQTMITDNQNNISLIILEGVGNTLFSFSVMFLIYVIIIKKKALDKYSMIPLTINYQFFQIFVLFIFIGGIERITSSILQVSRSIWTTKIFNHKIASVYSKIIWENDIHWMVISILSFCLFCIGSFVFESIFFKLYNPTSEGPIAFQLV